jgi:hypothetical protein
MQYKIKIEQIKNRTNKNRINKNNIKLLYHTII